MPDVVPPDTYTPPSFEALVAEQEVVQAEKFQGGMLAHYNAMIFPGMSRREYHRSAVSDFFDGRCTTERITLQGVVTALHETLGRPIHWADMAGGRGLAQRELASKYLGPSALRLTNVDLFEYGFVGLNANEMEFLETKNPDIQLEEYAPKHVLGNVETVQLDEPVDLITSVQAMQYLNDPLRAIANWYNQLRDGGYLLVGTAHDWPSFVHFSYDPEATTLPKPATERMLRTLKKSNIPHAATNKPDDEFGNRDKIQYGEFRTLVLQKKPQTALSVLVDVERVWANYHNYKVVDYARPNDKNGPVIEVVSASN